MAYGKGQNAKTTHRRSVEIGRIKADTSAESLRLKSLVIGLADTMSASVWPSSPLVKRLDKKEVDTALLAVQTSGVSQMNSIWREKTRMFVKDALIEQSKRLRRCAYGKVLNAASTMRIVEKDDKGSKIEKTIYCNVPRDIPVEPKALDQALLELAKRSAKAPFEDVVRMVDQSYGHGLTADQKTVLAAMRQNLLERWSRPTWGKPYSAVRLNLDQRCIGAKFIEDALDRLNQALRHGERYIGVLPLSGVEPHGPKIVLPLAFDRERIEKLVFGPRPPKPPRLIKGGKTVPANNLDGQLKPYLGPMRFSALAVEIDGEDVIVKAIISKEKAVADQTSFKRLVGRDFGFVNTISLSVLEFEQPVDVAVAATFKGMSREAALERLTTHVAPHGMKVVETVLMSGRNFLDRVEAQSKRIDVLRSQIDLLYGRIKTIKTRLCKALGLAETELVPETLPEGVRDIVLAWHGKMFRLLKGVAKLKARRIGVYRSVDGLKKSWFGFLSNMEVRLALDNGAAHVREDLTILAKEKTDPKYRGRTFNKMTNNGSKGQYILRAEQKFEWHGVKAVDVPSWFTSTNDHRNAVVDAKQRYGESFTAMIDGMKSHADLHASETIGCWLALVPMTDQQKQMRQKTLNDNALSDKQSSRPKRQAA